MKKDYFYLLIVCLLMLLGFCISCKTIDITGRHKVQYVKTFRHTQVVKFYGLDREFTFTSDTIKKNDFITFKKIK